MFGFPRLIDLVAKHDGVQDLISTILAQLDQFRGDEGEQEDDVTMVTIRRTSSALESSVAFGNDLDEVASFTLDSTLGKEREAMVRVAEIVVGLGLGGERLERLKTAVSEAAMNAIEHGNQGDPELPVAITVLADNERILVRIRDQGGGRPIPDAVLPNLEAKLAGDQSPRGWGLFLIEKMVDAMRTSTDDQHHTIELEMSRKET
jgi:anti-sigma regulatory factor (Ser/Thr protein kinase)